MDRLFSLCQQAIEDPQSLAKCLNELRVINNKWESEKNQLEEYTEILQREIIVRNSKIVNKDKRIEQLKGMLNRQNKSVEYQEMIESDWVNLVEQIQKQFSKDNSMEAINLIQNNVEHQGLLSTQLTYLVNRLIEHIKQTNEKNKKLVKVYQDALSKQSTERDSFPNSEVQRKYLINEKIRKNQQIKIKQLNNQIADLISQMTKRQIMESHNNSKEDSYAVHTIENSQADFINQHQYFRIAEQNQILRQMVNNRGTSREEEGNQLIERIQSEIQRQYELINKISKVVNCREIKFQGISIETRDDLIQYLGKCNNNLQLVYSKLLTENKPSTMQGWHGIFKNQIQNVLKSVDELIKNERYVSNNNNRIEVNTNILQNIFIEIKQMQLFVHQNLKKQNRQQNGQLIEMVKLLISNQTSIKQYENKLQSQSAEIHNLKQRLLQQKQKQKQQQFGMNKLRSQIQKLTTQKTSQEAEHQQHKVQWEKRRQQMDFQFYDLARKLSIKSDEIQSKDEQIRNLRSQIVSLRELNYQLEKQNKDTKMKCDHERNIFLQQVQKTTQKFKYIEKLAQKRFENTNKMNRINSKSNTKTKLTKI